MRLLHPALRPTCIPPGRGTIGDCLGGGRSSVVSQPSLADRPRRTFGPIPHGMHDGAHRSTQGSEGVLDSHWHLGINLPGDETVPFEVAQDAGQYLGAHSQLALKVVEPNGPALKGIGDEHGPPIRQPF